MSHPLSLFRVDSVFRIQSASFTFRRRQHFSLSITFALIQSSRWPSTMAWSAAADRSTRPCRACAGCSLRKGRLVFHNRSDTVRRQNHASYPARSSSAPHRSASLEDLASGNGLFKTASRILVIHKKTREWSMPSIAEIAKRRTLVRRAERQAWGWPNILHSNKCLAEKAISWQAFRSLSTSGLDRQRRSPLTEGSFFSSFFLTFVTCKRKPEACVRRLR